MLNFYNVTYIIHLLLQGWNCEGLQYLLLKYKLLKLERKVLELEYGEGSVFYIKFGILLGTAQKSTRIYFVLRKKKNTGMCVFPYSWGKKTPPF